MTKKSKWILTTSSIGVLSYMLTDIVHEVIGHGGTCIMIGQNIKLISSVYFKSSAGSFITDIGGPIANLFFALLYAFLQFRKSRPILTLLLLTTMSYNLFWFCGTILQSAFSKNGDWTYAIKELNMGTPEKPFLVILSITAYFFSIKLVRTRLTKTSLHFPELSLRQIIYYSYFGATIAAVTAALFFKHDRIFAAFEGLLEMMASLPILFTVRVQKVKINDYEPATNLIFGITTFILFIAFCLTLGVGIT